VFGGGGVDADPRVPMLEANDPLRVGGLGAYGSNLVLEAKRVAPVISLKPALMLICYFGNKK
jgi:hypothetical protein